MEFSLPSDELKPEDYEPVQLFGFKEFYKNYFTDLLYKVRYKFNNYNEFRYQKKKKISVFVDKYCLGVLKTLFTLEEMTEMNIQIDHIFTGQDSFGKYVNKFSTKSGIKLAEQMIVLM